MLGNSCTFVERFVLCLFVLLVFGEPPKLDHCLVFSLMSGICMFFRICHQDDARVEA